jgi:hypothetical protein
MTKINERDYVKILQFYNKPIPNSKRLIQKQAEKILAEKLCRCIKKLEPINEARSIGICTKTIFNNKGYTRGKFSCKKRQHVNFRKSIANKKTRKIVYKRK